MFYAIRDKRINKLVSAQWDHRPKVYTQKRFARNAIRMLAKPSAEEMVPNEEWEKEMNGPQRRELLEPYIKTVAESFEIVEVDLVP